MSVVVVSGTGTEIGKTVVTAAVASVFRAQGRSVAVVKPAQTGVAPGEPGDVAEVARLAGAVTGVELARFPEPLAPATAARRAGMATVRPRDVVEAVEKLAAEHDLVLVVAPAGLGTLNAVALTAEALRARELEQLGVVVGSWPGEPDLAARCNLADLPEAAGAPLLGAVPEGAGALAPAEFRARAGSWLAGRLGGEWDAQAFTAAVR